MNLTNCIEEIRSDRVRNLFVELYGTQNYVIEKQKQRYERAVQAFHEFFPTRTDIKIYSAPGRTEIGGNHTDHQRGIVLAGAVNLDVIAIVSFHNEGVIRVKSEGYVLAEIQLSDLNPNEKDDGTMSLVKGVVTKFKEKNVTVKGFDIIICVVVMFLLSRLKVEKANAQLLKTQDMTDDDVPTVYGNV